MSEAQFTLSWDSFQRNICSGIGALQQNEDLVDMTLAADGHFVRVHQLVLSLASPYIRDLIKSAQCQNPVIFLNKISSATLALILEYIYTGQVNVAKEQIEEVLQAAKALHIKGLMDMSYNLTLSDATRSIANTSKIPKRETQQTMINAFDTTIGQTSEIEEDCFGDSFDDTTDTHTDIPNNTVTNKEIQDTVLQSNVTLTSHQQKSKLNALTVNSEPVQCQFTVSNKGSLQMVLNRFVYFLRYTGKAGGHRQWRCTDYAKKKCPASVTTVDNVVIRRAGAHIHPFHDKKIAKRVKANAIFSVISEAQKQGDNMKEIEKQNT